jgi:hypothetical protein
MVGVFSASGFEFYRVSLLPRAAFECYCLFYFLKMLGKQINKNLFAIQAIICISLIVGFSTYLLMGQNFSIAETVITANKYLLPFIVFPLLYKQSANTKALAAIERLYSFFIFFASFAVISGLLLDIKIFRSYDFERFGYKGFFFSVNEASLFFILAQIYGTLRVLRKKGWLILFLATVAGIFLGTKAGIIAPLLVWPCAIVARFHRSKIMLLIITLLVPISISIIWLKLPKLLTNSTAIAWYSQASSKSGVATMLFSSRNKFLEERFMPAVLDRSWVNYLFGGIDISKYAIEMDFCDLFLFMGMVGSCAFIAGYTLLFFGNGFTFFGLFALLICMLLAAIAGHVFISGSNGAYLVLIAALSRNMMTQKRNNFPAIQNLSSSAI